MVAKSAADLLASLQSRDSSLWPEPNVSSSRLGWLGSPETMLARSAELSSWARTIDQSTIILLGMGGSSLGPAVLAETARIHGRPSNGRRLVVCDTTHPMSVGSLDFSDAFVVVSSKSGTTLEPNVLLAHAWEQMSDPQRFAVITDPGTPLQRLGAERGFRRVFENPADIGGRYSVLSFFGMVPAALIGYDVAELCERALDADAQRGVEMGLSMGQAVRQGQDKATFIVPEDFASFGLWVEQLVAESTGKRGTGCVPVPTTQSETGPDRHVIELPLREVSDLGELFFSMEIAAAICGHALHIDPFDEPNVAESKQNTNEVLARLPLPVQETLPVDKALGWLEDTVQPGDYVSLQAYVPFGLDNELERLRRSVRDKLGGVAVTAGFGPRFLHSTGQLHKGGPNVVVALQILASLAGRGPSIPGKPYDFATLIEAQAIGDRRSLVSHGRRVATVSVDDLSEIA